MHMQSRVFWPSFNNRFDDDSNLLSGDLQGDSSKIFPMGMGLPDGHRVMQVYFLPSNEEHEHSPWKVAGMSMLLIGAVLAALVIIYYIVVRCCCSKKKIDPDVEENSEASPNDNGSLPSEIPPLGAEDKLPNVPASFLESPTLNVSQPFQPEPEDMARMQEIMLAKLESTNDDWDMGHGDLDKRPLY